MILGAGTNIREASTITVATLRDAGWRGDGGGDDSGGGGRGTQERGLAERNFETLMTSANIMKLR